MAGPSSVWALGDYPKLARETIASLGPALVAACEIQPGANVLDVAAGAGNVAIPAAAAGACVTALDLAPELIVAGRAAAADVSVVGIDWVQGDAQALPFGDDAFDVVVSSVGVIFAPDHARAAAELTRVCRPGGTLGLINWTPEGSVGRFFELLHHFAPPPAAGEPSPPSPILWGTEGYVRKLFGHDVASLECSRGAVAVDHFADVDAMAAYYRAHFGPFVAAYASVAGDAERTAELDRATAALARDLNRAPDGARPHYEWEYLLVRAVVA